MQSSSACHVVRHVVEVHVGQVDVGFIYYSVFVMIIL